MPNRQERFMVSHEEKEFGPLTREEIAARLRSGEFSVVDFVYVEEQADWITLLEFCPEVNLASPSVGSALKEPGTPAPAPAPKVSETGTEKTVEKQRVKSSPAVSSEKAIPLEKVELKGGLGTIDLVQFAAGQVRLSVQGTLESPQPLPLVVRAAPAEKVTIKGPAEGVAGETCAFHLEAVDKFGNRDSAFSGSVSVVLSGSAQGAGTVKFKDGQAKFDLTNKVAESVVVKLSDAEKTGLDVNASATIAIHAAKATRLVLVAPEEAVAGQPVKVTVKAVDAFGNLATQFGGEVKLEVDSPVLKKASGS